MQGAVSCLCPGMLLHSLVAFCLLTLPPLLVLLAPDLLCNLDLDLDLDLSTLDR